MKNAQLYVRFEMRIEWDARKNRQNVLKHKISFERAGQVFSDPRHLSLPDDCETEDRWRTLGLVGAVVIIVVIHTLREGPDGERRNQNHLS
jgi:uncharacterized protein